jgi:hypothetical protein
MLKPVQYRVRPAVIVIVVAAVLAATIFFLVINSGEDAWNADCVSAPAAADQPTAAINEAREALLRTGNKAVLGIDIVDLGSCSHTVTWKSEEALPTASIVKLLIVLDLIERSGLPDGSEAEDVRRMLSASDDTVASRLWQENGGPSIVQRQVRALKLAHTRPPDDKGKWGDTRMSPADITDVYRHITGVLPSDEREFVTEALANASRNAADGFDQYFGIPRGLPEAAWAVKQGWGSSDGRRVLNTTGLVRTNHIYAVTLMSTWSDDVTWSTATNALTSATQALRNSLNSAEKP